MSFRGRSAAGLTRRYQTLTVADLDAGASYVFAAAGTEERAHAPVWDECKSKRSAQCIEIADATRDGFRARRGHTEINVSLADTATISTLFGEYRHLFLDISGLPHHVWAPLVKHALIELDILDIVYVEPADYRRHPSPTSRSQFDLSEGFDGVAPLPGFAKLRGPNDEQLAIFVALLGVEGTRARVVAQALDPVPTVHAVVGIPGFRLEFPQLTVVSNHLFLSENDARHRLRYASAACPYECFDVLTDIHRAQRDRYMYLAPVGTKPHALAAVCYAIRNPNTTELMYDHPRRKPGRTQGIGTAHIYRLKPSYVAG